MLAPGDEAILAEVFDDIDEEFFRPHPLTPEEAGRIVGRAGRDLYAILVENGRAFAYGLLRGWEEGYEVPSLGIAVRTTAQGRGLARLMMSHLHDAARVRGASAVRLRVHADNLRARHLYESMGYYYAGDERGELVMVLHLHPEGELSSEGHQAPGR